MISTTVQKLTDSIDILIYKTIFHKAQYIPCINNCVNLQIFIIHMPDAIVYAFHTFTRPQINF